MSTKYEPFINLSGLDRLQEEIGKIFNLDEFVRNDVNSTATARWRPTVDIFEVGEQYVIEVDLPGVNSNEIDIDLKAGVLSVSGTRETASIGLSGYKRKERKGGDFFRRFTLPESADEQSVKASSDNGVLTIRISKKKESDSQSRKIQVVSG